MSEAQSIKYLRSLAYELTNLDYKSLTAQPAAYDPLLDGFYVNSDGVRTIINTIKEYQGAIASMIPRASQIYDLDLFLYFINQFHELTRKFMKRIDSFGEIQIKKEQDFRSLLSQLQISYIKILAIYEIYHSRIYPSIDVLEKKVIPFLEDLLDELIKTRENSRGIQAEENDYTWLQNTTRFQSTRVQYTSIFFLNVIKTLFMFYTLFRNTDLNPAITRPINRSIARILLRVITIHEKTDRPTLTINMPPGNLLQRLYEILNELEGFLNFTKNYIEEINYNVHLKFANLRRRRFLHPNSISPPQNGVIEFFTRHSCLICQEFFQSALWKFLRQVSQDLSLQIHLIDLEKSEDQLALSTGIYGIRHVPILKYKDQIYKIRSVKNKESGQNPHNKAIREILNFLGVLGQYNYESSPLKSVPKVKSKSDEAKKPKIHHQVAKNGD